MFSKANLKSPIWDSQDVRNQNILRCFEIKTYILDIINAINEYYQNISIFWNEHTYAVL